MSGAAQAGGAQTLLRGLDILETVAAGRCSTAEICADTGLSADTARRLARTLAERGYLSSQAGGRLTLGATIRRLASDAARQLDLIAVARPLLETLADATLEAVHLAVEHDGQVRYVHMVAGRRRLALRSVVGETRPMTRTSLGKALMLDLPEAELRRRYEAENGPADGPFASWLERHRAAMLRQTTGDDAEFEPNVHCIGAPVRAAGGRIVAAISVSTIGDGAMDDWRQATRALVRETADAISAALGACPVGEDRPVQS
jgi:DNA-binding IclR family transcriptional regulator